MVRPSRESLNELFSTLAEWNACLADIAPVQLDPQAARARYDKLAANYLS